jgi:small subunit ribosomal protein S2
MSVISLAQMLEAGVHFGHQARRWNPKMSEYIFTERNGVHIIDLVQTAQLMDDAYYYVRSAAESGKRFLFVGTKRQAAGIVAQEALRCGSYYVNQRWLGGMLTNWTTIKTRIDRLKDLERRHDSGVFELLPKQEASKLRRELEKLEKYLGGLKMMNKLPDVVIMIDVRREYNAVQECQKLGLPIVSLLDTNCDPDWVDIPIPANDDAIRSIKLVVGKLADAIYEGRHGEIEMCDEDEDDDTFYSSDEDLIPDEDDFNTASKLSQHNRSGLESRVSNSRNLIVPLPKTLQPVMNNLGVEDPRMIGMSKDEQIQIAANIFQAIEKEEETYKSIERQPIVGKELEKEIIRVKRYLEDLFGSSEKEADRWLKTKRADLGGKAAQDYLESGKIWVVENLIYSLEAGIPT